MRLMVAANKLNPNWNLSQLYSSFEDQSFIRDLSDVEKEFSEIQLLLVQDMEITSEYLLNCLKRLDEVSMLLTKVTSYVNLTLMVESSHSQALHYVDKISSLEARSQQLLILFKNKVGNLNNIENLISECKELLPYEYLLRESYKVRKNNAPVEVEEIISQMQGVGSRAWQKLRDSLDGAAMVPIRLNNEDKILPLPAVRSLASDPCQDTRRIAYFAELKSYKSYETPMAACLNAIKGDALTTLQWRGDESVLDRMLDINKMDAETLDAMMESIESSLPAFRSYLRTKAQILGHKNGLPWYDLLAPVGQIKKTYTYEDAYKCLKDVFTDFDENMGDFIGNAFENGWIDAMPKEGKVGGALCADLPSLRQNRIFANFGGSYSDLRLLAHELGHAFHSRCLDDVPLILRDPPTPICETASIFNETILQEQLLKNSSDEEQIFLLEAGLRESTQTVVDIYSRFIFEKEVFERRKSHSLSADELCEIMVSAQKAAYGEGLDPEYLHPYMWMCKVHYYIPEFHYYNFPYTFGLLFSKGLYARYKGKPEGFINEYINLLKSTCTNDLVEIAADVDIDIHSRAFWDSSLEMIIKDINHFIELCNKNY